MNLVKALRKDDEFLSDINSLIEDQDNFYLWWLGQSGFLLQWRGQRLLIDPYLPASQNPILPGTTGTYLRIGERVIDPSRLTGINLVAISHTHSGHLDAETIIPLLATNPEMQMVIPEATRLLVTGTIRKNLYYPIGLSEGKSVTAGHFTIQGISSAHPNQEQDENGNDLFMGYIISFGNWNIYHCGDTILYDGLVEKLNPFQVDLALLPINGHNPLKKESGNLNTTEAVYLARSVEAKWLIPCHYDMFAFNNADVNAFADIAIKSDQPYCILDIGGKISSYELKPVNFQE